MTASIAVDDGPWPALFDRFQRGIEHGVGQIGVWFGPDGPADDHAIEAVDDWRQIYFSGPDPELRNVGQPLLIWRISLKVGKRAADPMGYGLS